ncbi:DUF3783 domain-containing protein [Desulfococcus sp.]|uniref:DUF3783 domain-containing protein n=1 Tax=Desulfococcus sp. TaxID=2025834 RepID=UPI0035943583
MSDGDFQAVGTSDERMFGPRKIIVCGFSAEEQDTFGKMAAAVGMADMPLVFAGEGEADDALGEIVDLPQGTGLGRASVLERAVILSGLTERELHAVMAGYRGMELPRTLWATLTESSVTWPLSELLKELAAERAAFLRRQSQDRP